MTQIIIKFYEIVILKVEEITENPHVGTNENPYAIRSAIETLVHQTLQTKASTPQIHIPPQDRSGYKYSILKETN